MAEWRFLRSWSDGEIAARLERVTGLSRNFSLDEPMTKEAGWNLTHSVALVARGTIGPPVVGKFEHLARATERFRHSDPRIVVVHYRQADPLVGRHVLLELRALGLRYLCPALIGGARDETNDGQTVRGFALDTLEGHIERGREWFLIVKDHETGEVRFHIEAVWREGEFPNFWSRLGFRLVGRRYQRAWHRLVHMRMRRIAAGLDPDVVPDAAGVVHQGAPIPTEPVQFIAQRGIGRREADVEQEGEEMQTDGMWRALGMGALSGVRSAGGPALLARAFERGARRPFFGRRRRGLATPLTALAAAELVADKLPFTPPRTQAPSVAARALSGALVATAAAGRGAPLVGTALLGACAATAATWASYHLRRLGLRHSRTAGHAVAVAEDALVLWAGSRMARAAARRR